MSNKKIAILTIGFAAAGIAWYAFRPELLFVNQKVNESLPGVAQAATGPGQPMALFRGKFRGIAHKTDGTATVYNTAGDKKLLRLTGFETSNGPDVHVYLVAAKDAKDSAAVKTAGFIVLGKLKGNQGDQKYEVPADADLNKYQAVTIWCARFGVNFGTAPLMMEKPMANAGEPATLSTGKFHGVAHETAGSATLYQLEGGKDLVRLTGFKTSNGPDVHVYLVAAKDAKDSSVVKTAGFIDLGKLKGNEGDQNYDIPAGTDLNKYKSVTIWCARFGVNFGTAPLM